jgi:hypothetical protein
MGKSRVGYGGPPQQENRDEDEDEEIGKEDRFVYEDEHARQMLGDRYDEFKERFERAVNAVDIDALCDLAGDFADANLPWCREKSRENKKTGCPMLHRKTERHRD